MQVAVRYFRLLFALARYGIARELAFRSNFVVKISVEVLWLCILLAFYKTIFAKTSVVANWTEAEYLFFIGCYFAMEGFIETFFLENCNEFADLVRTGDLDFYLLKPIDEQFLVTCRKIDWSTAPNFLMGAAVMGLSLWQMHWAFDWWQAVMFVVMFGCGPIRGVLLKFRKLSLVPLKPVGARTPSSKIEVMTAASRRADVKVFVRCVVMFCLLC